jgi:hypothetical protein
MKANVEWREIEWKCFYETQAVSLEAKTLSGREAVRNVYPLALKRNPEIAEFNPLALWDLCYLRKLTTRIYQPTVRANAQLSKDEWLVKGKYQKSSLNIGPSYSFALIPRIRLQFGDRLIRIQ